MHLPYGKYDVRSAYEARLTAHDVFAFGKHEGKKRKKRAFLPLLIYNAFCLAKSFLNFALCTLHFALKTMFALTICLALWERCHAERDGEGLRTPSQSLSRQLSLRESLICAIAF